MQQNPILNLVKFSILWKHFLLSKYANSLPDIVGIWVRDWNKAEKALSIRVAINKQKERVRLTDGHFHIQGYSFHCVQVKNGSNLVRKYILTTARVVTTQAVAYVRVTTGICKYSCWNVWYAILLIFYKDTSVNPVPREPQGFFFTCGSLGLDPFNPTWRILGPETSVQTLTLSNCR